MPISRLSSMVRAFVVLFQSDVNVRERRLSGRIEHVRTGDVVLFNSLDELLRFVEDRIEADRKEWGTDSTAKEWKP
jgi:hypothetical protein